MSFDPPPLPAQYGNLQVWWEAVRQGLKTEFGALEAADIAQAAAIAAQATANTAVTNAAAAQTTANTASTTATAVKKTDKISASWTSPGAVLSATDAGTDATVVVAAHTRHWGDASSTSVNSHSFTAKAYSTTYYVYYDDPNQNDTTPAYNITTNPNTAAPNAAANRVYVGTITTPASGGGGTSGGTLPPGGGYSGPGSIP